jgi:hypothetical protein
LKDAQTEDCSCESQTEAVIDSVPTTLNCIFHIGSEKPNSLIPAVRPHDSGVVFLELDHQNKRDDESRSNAEQQEPNIEPPGLVNVRKWAWWRVRNFWFVARFADGNAPWSPCPILLRGGENKSNEEQEGKDGKNKVCSQRGNGKLLPIIAN